MDLGVLSAENYQERAYSQMQTAEGGENNQLYGGLLVNHEESSSGPVSRKRMKTRDSSKKVTSTNASADEVSHQRGRPRLDTRDRNAAEVCFADRLLLLFSSSNAMRIMALCPIMGQVPTTKCGRADFI